MFCEDQEELNYMERVFVDRTWVDREDTYNLCLGGGYNSTHEVRSAAAKKRCARYPRKPFLGHKHTAESLAKMSARNKGRKNPKAVAAMNKACRKPVVQYTLDGKMVAEYPSLNMAEKSTGILHGNISSVCRGVFRHAGGYVWKYKV